MFAILNNSRRTYIIANREEECDLNAKSNEVMTAAVNAARCHVIVRKCNLGTVDRSEIDFRAAVSQGN